MGSSRHIFGKLISTCEMSLIKEIQDGASQIHMIARGEVISRAETRTETGEMIHVEHLWPNGVNFDVGDEVNDDEDNGDYFEDDKDNADYQGGHSKHQVNFAAGGGNDSTSDLELDEIDERNTDIEIEARLLNHSVADEYRDAERSGDCDVLQTFANANLSRKWNGDKGRSAHLFGGSLRNPETCLKGTGKRNVFARTAVKNSHIQG